jgi:tRNA pseudouridine38-40 synthase
MYTSNIAQPLMCDALQISPNLNFKNMKKFLKLLVGTHDFAGFRASGSETESSVRTIYSANLKKQGNYLHFTITGNGFLYKMVRNIVGTMLKIGEGKINLKAIKPTLFSTFKATNTAKPEFLYLLNVEY